MFYYITSCYEVELLVSVKILQGGKIMAQKAIRVALIYMVISILLGMYIGITHTFNSNLISVHSHMLFIGWIFFTLVGILYFLFPTAGESTLAKWAFVIQNIGIRSGFFH